MLRKCSNCSSIVLPTSDGQCPSCRHPIGGSPAVALDVDVEQARYELEESERKRKERIHLKQLRSARNIIFLGVLLAGAAIAGSFFFPPDAAERLVLRIVSSIGIIVLVIGFTKRYVVSRTTA